MRNGFGREGAARADVTPRARRVHVPLRPSARPDRVVIETVAAILEGGLDVDGTLQAVARAARQALGSDRASCFVHDGEDVPVVAVHTTAEDPRERAFLERTVGMPASRLPICTLLLSQRDPVLVVEDVDRAGSVPPELAARLGSGAFVGVRLEHPSIVADGRPALLGTLFMSFRRPQRFSEPAIRAARSLGGFAALAIANARLHARTLSNLAEAERRASVDPLTGLANHRTFHEALRAAVDDARHERCDLSLVLLDIDHFKQVNDAHGHQAGDRVLVEVARRLEGVVRDGDLVARIGGEEFAWLLPGAGAAEAAGAAERARAAVSEPMPVVGALTASAGVCDLLHAGHADELFSFCDGALYWAKAHGRDVTVRYAPEVVTDLSADERAERLEHARALAGLRALARAVDAKDPSTRRHSERVAHLAVQLATAAGWPVTRSAALLEAGLLHDVGKIGVPDAVLSKPGRLTADEYDTVKEHATLGATIASEVLSAEQVSWIRHHHERWDGGGYPGGLAGEETPEGARILALADAWDVMTSARSYKSPLSPAEALTECRAHAGSQFAPELVDALVRLQVAGALGDEACAPSRRARTSARPVPSGFAGACRRAVEELLAATGWEEAFVSRLDEDALEIIAAGGAGLVSVGSRTPLADALCARMLDGRSPAAHGRLSDPRSGYADVAARAELGVESYSGHPIVLPDGSVFGTLCAVDRRPRPVPDAGRELGGALAGLLGWEHGRERAVADLARARSLAPGRSAGP